MNNKSFPCTSCGSCCKRIDKLVKNIKAHNRTNKNKMSFPYKHDETGRCEKLMDDNRCAVYNNRPLVCNIDKMSLLINISREKWYKMNADACNKMQEEDDISEEYRINL